MIRRTWAFCVLSILAALFARAEDWAPIPPEVWAMQERPGEGIKGAVVLQDRIEFHGTYLEYVFRVRILNESGLSAAEFSDFSSDCYDFSGRTVYPDGRQVTFTKKKDFMSKTAVETTSFGVKVTKVVPPGLNGNCLVEMRWRESAAPWGPLPARMGRYGVVTFGNRFLTKETSVQIPISFRYAYSLTPGRSKMPQVVEKGSFKTFIFRDLPGYESAPYALDSMRDTPRLVVYEQLPNLISGLKNPDLYWRLAFDAYWKRTFDGDVTRRSRYSAFSSEMLKDLPNTPHKKAFELFLRLQARIRNTSRLTHDEAAIRTKEQIEREIESSNLETTIKEGETDGTGMKVMFFHLLKSAGLDPIIALVEDRDRGIFRYDFPNVWQFTNELIGVEEEGRIVWFSPNLRFISPAVVHPDYQGTPALQVRSKDWSLSRITIPAQPAQMNQTLDQYLLRVEEDEDAFTLRRSYSGIPEYNARWEYMVQDQASQDRQLKEGLERQFKGVVLSKAHVSNAQSANQNLMIDVEGRVEALPGRRRTIVPFPVSTLPLWIPDAFPTERTENVFMSYLRTVTSTCRFQIPKGYRLGEVLPTNNRNGLGSVRWAVDREEKDGVTWITVTYKVEVTGFFLDPKAYGDLKTFLGWVSDAARRTLVLDKS